MTYFCATRSPWAFAKQETVPGRRSAVKPPPKKPYTKPRLTKHKHLRDITAAVASNGTV